MTCNGLGELVILDVLFSFGSFVYVTLPQFLHLLLISYLVAVDRWKSSNSDIAECFPSCFGVQMNIDLP